MAQDVKELKAILDQAETLAVTLKRSKIGRNKKQIGTVDALGLKKIGQTVIIKNTPQARGMINKIDFMLEVKEA